MLLQTNSGDMQKPARSSEAHAFRGAVPPHEKLLLLAILVVVAAWILFRVALMLFATVG
jgi:hypothetical protein